jgi:peroxiredoxin
VLLGVNVDADPEVMRQTMQKRKITGPTVWDGAGGPIAAQYGVTGLPTVFLIDANGNIRMESQGAPDERDLEAAIDELLQTARGPDRKETE